MAASRLVSIVTPTYNHAESVESCIRSVLAQGHADWEMIVVDDGSTDGTPELVEAFDDPRIRVIRLPHRGLDHLGESYNEALAQAQGELVAILEGDDLWPPDKLERQVPDFDEEGVVLSSGRFEVRDEAAKLRIVMPLELPADEIRNNEPRGRAALWMLDPQGLTFTFPVTVVMRRHALMAAGGFLQPEHMPVVDYGTFLRMTLQGSWRFHNAVMGIWRRHGGSTTRSRFPFIFESCYRHAAEFADRRRRNLPISNDEWAALDQKWQYVQVNRLVELGRLKARSGDKQAAARAFGRAHTFRMGTRDRLALPLATVLAQAGMSPEGAFKLVGRGGVRCGQAEAAGDSIVHAEMSPEAIARHSLLAAS